MHTSSLPDLLVFSHLRWDFVFQRPQHLMTRQARHRRVFFFEEPLLDCQIPWLERRQTQEGVTVAIPHVRRGSNAADTRAQLSLLVSQLEAAYINPGYTVWYYTPMALPFSRHLNPATVIFDCMDELSAFRFAPPELVELERELLGRAHAVFTGGKSIYEAKRHMHHNIYPFPSSIDVGHFRAARAIRNEPLDQRAIPHPRIGFYGVIDERMDLDLIRTVAEERPAWHLILIGPVVKIDPDSLPRARNIHYLGMKKYAELPAYLAGWDVAMMPFAMNESTRFISPTKTLEYMAAGKPVVSTPIRDVVSPYGESKLVRIADGPHEFIRAVQASLRESSARARRLKRNDEFLQGTSWDLTAEQMMTIEAAVHATRRPLQLPAGLLQASV